MISCGTKAAWPTALFLRSRRNKFLLGSRVHGKRVRRRPSRWLTTAAVWLVAACLGGTAGAKPVAPQATNDPSVPFVWPSQPPADCPFRPSSDFDRIVIQSRHRWVCGADTWYPSWAADGQLYSGWTDGIVNGWANSSAEGAKAATIAAKIIGDDPMSLRVENISRHVSSSLPYAGRYPCAYLVHNGVWYYGTYCLDNETRPDYPYKWGSNPQAPSLILKHPFRKGPDIQALNYSYIGPFVGFRVSTDLGKTWTETPHTAGRPLFNDPLKAFGPTKIGSPHFVDFGRNMEHSPDGKAYLVAHGAVDDNPAPRPAAASWITGDAVYLLRVKPTPRTINDPSAYEFFAGYGRDGQPLWTGDFARMKPLAQWNNNMGCATMAYNAPLKRYFLTVTDGTDTIRAYNSYILESRQITGPWKLVSYMRNFGEQAYFINFPSKFHSSDGQTMWMLYSGNYANFFELDLKANLPGSRYGMIWQEIRLLRPGQPPP